MKSAVFTRNGEDYQNISINYRKASIEFHLFRHRWESASMSHFTSVSLILVFQKRSTYILKLSVQTSALLSRLVL